MDNSRSRGRRGSALILYTLLLPTILLMVGLAIDLGMLYVIQTRLSAAADGAALGAGRLLGSNANTTEIAKEFLQANYPSGYWGTTDFSPSINYTTVSSLHTISVTATVTAPLLFLRLLNQQSAKVSATATAVRRDVRIEMVLDRSYSMIDQMSNLRTAATNFINMFTPDTDEMGLVLLGGGGTVVYPTTRPYSFTTGTGPNKQFADAVTAGHDNMLTMVSSLALGSDTNTSESLWLAYEEIKKAAALDTDLSRLNVIVLFTDGVPNGFTAYLNDPANNVLSGGSGCTYNPSVNSSTQMIGWIASTGAGSGLAFFDPSASNTVGLYFWLPFDTSQTAKYWDSQISVNGYVNDLIDLTGTPVTGCGGGRVGTYNLTAIPPQDYYGHSTSSTAYTQGVLYQRYGVAYNSSLPGNGYHMGLASWAAADNTARAILADTDLNIVIYCIGFTGNGGVDPVLLKRIANTQDSSGYNSSWQTGMYLEASDAQTLNQAFVNVANEVLKLTK